MSPSLGGTITAAGAAVRAGVRDAVGGVARARPIAALLDGLESRLRSATEDLAVLTFHRIDAPAGRPWLDPALISATPEELDQILRWVRRRFTVLSIADLRAGRGARRLPTRALMLTFDDGYADFGEHAWPALSRLGLPATLFVPTEAIDAATAGIPTGTALPDGTPREPTASGGTAGRTARLRSAFWWDRLHAAIARATEAVVRTPTGPIHLARLRGDPHERRRLVQQLKGLSHDDILGIVDALERAAANAPAPASWELDVRADRPDLLDWPALARMLAAGLTVASHTRRHPILPRLAGDALAIEIARGRDELADRLPGADVGAFAYPSGGHDARTVRAVAAAGFDLAFTTERGLNRLGRTNALTLRRFNVGRRSSPGLLAAQLLAAPRAWPDRLEPAARERSL